MFRYSSILLCIAAAALVALGLTMLASTSVWVRGVEMPYLFLRKQTLMAIIGLGAAIGMALMSPELLRKSTPWLWLGCCFLLVLVLIPGVGVEIFGSRRWLQIPGIGTFQPSELAKSVIIISMATWFARWQSEVHTFWRGYVIPGMIVGVPILLIAVETDIGSALSMAVAVAAVLFCVGTRLRYLIPTALIAITGAGFYLTQNPNRWNRIAGWLDIENPALQNGVNMQQWQGLLALGNGGPKGVGLGNGTVKFDLILSHIDFIFPVIGEELGLAATLGVVLCYVLIAVCGVAIAVQAGTLFNRCLALGLTCVLVVPAMTNIAVTTAVLPNDGLPLPFVSFGGTSLVFSLAAVGMLVGIHRRSLVATGEPFPIGKTRTYAVRL